MRKQKGCLIAMMTREREYFINGVKYVVESSFEPPETDNSIRTRMEKIVKNELIDLPTVPPCDTMTAEYTGSAAEKEDC